MDNSQNPNISVIETLPARRYSIGVNRKKNERTSIREGCRGGEFIMAYSYEANSDAAYIKAKKLGSKAYHTAVQRHETP